MSLTEGYICIFTALFVLGILLLAPIILTFIFGKVKPGESDDQYFILAYDSLVKAQKESEPKTEKKEESDE